jgi:hypothetical protein
MSKTIFLFVSFLISTVTPIFCQNIVDEEPEQIVPSVVTTAFELKFPLKKPVWFSSYEGRYSQQLVHEGRFVFDNRNSSAIYGNEGNLIAFAATVERSEIPAEALNYMKEKYPYSTILDTIMVTRGINDVTFELGISISGEYIIKVFSDKGKFIKSTKA